MARRATRALLAMLAYGVLALPAVILAVMLAVILASTQAAMAASGQQPASPPVGIVITGMTPQWAVPGSVITVTGSVHNNSRASVTRPTVQLFGSSTPVASIDTSQSNSPATAPLPGATWHASGPLSAGASTDWSIRVRVSAIGMTTFGVYPVAAQVQEQGGSPLATTTTDLPFEPVRKGSHASSRTSSVKIAWLWPLIDIPLLNEPWQGNCSGAQASALVQSLSPSGRLGELVRVGSSDSKITWAVDPAVLVNVHALASCQTVQPRWAKAASTWLTSVQHDTAGRPMTLTPYGDPNAAALIAIGHGPDVAKSFEIGRNLASGILNRHNLDPTAATGPTGTNADPLAQAAGVAWSAEGVPGYATVENLANVDNVRTLVLSSSSAFLGSPYSVLKTLDGGGSYMTALLASQSLTQLLQARASTPADVFSISQRFLAETALLAQQVPAQPIVVAPPPRWDPPAALAAGLLADTSPVPWLNEVGLASLATARHIPIVPTENWPDGTAGPGRVTRSELRKLRMLEGEIGLLQGIRAKPDPELFLAVSALESSALQGSSSTTTDAMLATVARRIDGEQRAVRIIAEKRITLGGLKGSVPVSIDNRLGYAVTVQLHLQYTQANGIKIVADPQGPVTVPRNQTQTIRMRVQAAAVGSTTVTMLLTTKGGDPVSVPLRMTIQATQVGILGVIIFAAALGVFLIASAARAVRRGRPARADGEPAVDAPIGDHDRGGSAHHAETDTVNAERSELGAAGKPGP